MQRAGTHELLARGDVERPSGDARVGDQAGGQAEVRRVIDALIMAAL
jgi:hypothetical protein